MDQLQEVEEWSTSLITTGSEKIIELDFINKEKIYFCGFFSLIIKSWDINIFRWISSKNWKNGKLL
jgi:hypothetical protein